MSYAFYVLLCSIWHTALFFWCCLDISLYSVDFNMAFLLHTSVCLGLRCFSPSSWLDFGVVTRAFMCIATTVHRRNSTVHRLNMDIMLWPFSSFNLLLLACSSWVMGAVCSANLCEKPQDVCFALLLELNILVDCGYHIIRCNGFVAVVEYSGYNICPTV